MANPGASEPAWVPPYYFKSVEPSSREYDTERSRPWSQTCWTSAASYVQPMIETKFAPLIDWIVEENAVFAIRGCGRSPNPGFSSAEKTALVIHMQPMYYSKRWRDPPTNDNSPHSLKDGSTMKVVAGATWGEVYSFLEEHGLCAMGARDPNVGVDGFLLGGGYPIFPNLHGTGADCVKTFEIVGVVNSSRAQLIKVGGDTRASDQDRDLCKLFQALKGGGSNFGLLTAVDIAVFPKFDVEYTINEYRIDDYANILKAITRAQEAMEADYRLNVITTFHPDFVQLCLLFAKLPVSSSGSQGHRELEPIYALKSRIRTVKQEAKGTILSLAQAMADSNKPMRRTIGTVTTKVRYDLYLEVYNAWHGIVKKLPKGIVLRFTIQPVSPKCVKDGKLWGGNIMGLEEVSQCWWAFTAEWQLESDDELAQQAINDLVAATRNAAKKEDLLLDYLCMNFANASQDVLNSYGKDNVDTMREMAKKFDPKRVFQDLQNDGFLLRKIEE
ncbi:6-hydroxy-D-nicotine oxidase [Xylariaceae sp. FL1651]|nr:6-hydroxy-D-nicotine oxidase [Xylariaceae sp. FL1651]